MCFSWLCNVLTNSLSLSEFHRLEMCIKPQNQFFSRMNHNNIARLKAFGGIIFHIAGFFNNQSLIEKNLITHSIFNQSVTAARKNTVKSFSSAATIIAASKRSCNLPISAGIIYYTIGVKEYDSHNYHSPPSARR